MRVVSTEPFLTELASYFGQADKLVGISAACEKPEEADQAIKLNFPTVFCNSVHKETQTFPAPEEQAELLAKLTPEQILVAQDKASIELSGYWEAVKTYLDDRLDPSPQIVAVAPVTYDTLLQSYETVAKALQVPELGRRLVHRVKAQLMTWCDNFYDRMKSKRVTVIADLEPLKIAGWWWTDLIHQCSAISQISASGNPHQLTSWEEIIDFHPDVMLFAPESLELPESLRSFKSLEKLSFWEDILAVKRGQVFFASGAGSFYWPSAKILDPISILISAIAGFDSGYITERDTFYRLRWLEMQRHRF